MSLTEDARRRLIVATASTAAGNEIADSIDGLVITQPLTLYVETTGDDANPGTADRPFRTIQAALDYLKPLLIMSSVTVQIGIGTFDGFVLFENNLNTSGTLTIQGVKSTVDSGIGSSSAILTSSQTFTDGTKNWTVDEHVGRSLKVGTTLAPIVSNTATTLKILTTTNHVGVAYTIEKRDTIIGGTPVTVPQTTTQSMISVLTLTNTAIASTTSPTTAFGVLISRLDVRSASNSRALTARGAGLTLFDCSFTNPTASTASAVCALECRVGAGNCFFSNTLSTIGGRTIDIGAGSPNTSGLVRVVSSAILNTAASGISVRQIVTNTHFELVFGYVKSSATGLMLNGGTSFIFADFDGCTTAIGLGQVSSLSSIGNPVSAAMSTSSFTNCATCIAASGPLSHSTIAGFTAVVSGSGNTLVFSATQGAKIRCPATFTVTGTTEISVDGVASTLAAMRALTPKVFPAVPNAYGSYVYE